MADYRIAVLDIGKTNKKLFVYDSGLRCLNPDEEGESFPQVEVDGVLCDDVAAIHSWMIDALSDAAAQYGGIPSLGVVL